MTRRNRNRPEVFDLLTPVQLQSLPLLVSGQPAKDVAATVGVTPQTVSQWLNHDQEFRHALWLFKNDALDAARSQLQVAAIEAVAEVRKLVREGSTEQIRLKAAQIALDGLGLVGRRGTSAFDEAVITPAGQYCQELLDKLS
jgi:hypothetical protein